MSTPMPGQRAAQRPLRAATSAQRAIGRALQYTDAVADTFVIEIDGQWRQIVSDGPESPQRLVPYVLDGEEYGNGR